MLSIYKERLLSFVSFIDDEDFEQQMKRKFMNFIRNVEYYTYKQTHCL